MQIFRQAQKKGQLSDLVLASQLVPFRARRTKRRLKHQRARDVTLHGHESSLRTGANTWRPEHRTHVAVRGLLNTHVLLVRYDLC